jgi:hypothetical protein
VIYSGIRWILYREFIYSPASGSTTGTLSGRVAK